MWPSGGACKFVKLPSSRSLLMELVKGSSTFTGGGCLFLRGTAVIEEVGLFEVDLGGRPVGPGGLLRCYYKTGSSKVCYKGLGPRPLGER